MRALWSGDIVDELPLAQSTVSQHLKVLKEANHGFRDDAVVVNQGGHGRIIGQEPPRGRGWKPTAPAPYR